MTEKESFGGQRLLAKNEPGYDEQQLEIAEDIKKFLTNQLSVISPNFREISEELNSFLNKKYGVEGDQLSKFEIQKQNFFKDVLTASHQLVPNQDAQSQHQLAKDLEKAKIQFAIDYLKNTQVPTTAPDAFSANPADSNSQEKAS